MSGILFCKSQVTGQAAQHKGIVFFCRLGVELESHELLPARANSLSRTVAVAKKAAEPVPQLKVTILPLAFVAHDGHTTVAGHFAALRIAFGSLSLCGSMSPSAARATARATSSTSTGLDLAGLKALTSALLALSGKFFAAVGSGVSHAARSSRERCLDHGVFG